MPNLLKYGRYFLFSLLLVSYLQGAFQQPILEVIHIAAHVKDFIKGKAHHHTFHDHGEDHRHVGLEKIEASQDEQQNKTEQEIQLRKKIEMVEISIEGFTPLKQEVDRNFTYYFYIQDPLMLVKVPPPILV